MTDTVHMSKNNKPSMYDILTSVHVYIASVLIHSYSFRFFSELLSSSIYERVNRKQATKMLKT